MSREENLELLSDEIGVEISLVQTGATVGSFKIDILAEENQTGKKIVIENQLNRDHDHSSKLITLLDKIRLFLRIALLIRFHQYISFMLIIPTEIISITETVFYIKSDYYELNLH